MAITRMKMKQNKIVNSVKVQKRQIAKLLENGKEESARIKIENLIREEEQIKAMEIVEMFIELCSGRIALIAESKKPPVDMIEAPRLEVSELLEVRNQFIGKWGKKFVQKCASNKDLHVNQRVISKLSIKVPDPSVCVKKLKQIANEFDLEWESQKDLTLPFGVKSDISQGVMVMDPLHPVLQPPLQQQNQVGFQQVGFQPSNQFKPVELQPPMHMQNQPNVILPPMQPMNMNEKIEQVPSHHNEQQNIQQPSFQPQQIQPQMPPTVPSVDGLNQIQPNQNSFPPVSNNKTVNDNVNVTPSFDFDSLQKRFEDLKKHDQ